MTTRKLSDILAYSTDLYGSTPEEVVAAMRYRQTGAVPPDSVSTQPPDNSMADNIMRRLASGITFGLADEGSAAATAGVESIGDWWNDMPVNFGERYDAALELERATDDAFLENHPRIAIGSELAGEVVSALAGARTFPGLNPSNALSINGKIIGGGVLGGASFGLGGFGRGRGTEDRLERAADGVKAGAVFGVGGSLLGMLMKKQPKAAGQGG
jgi:hypothetical protein